MKTNAIRILDKLKIAYELRSYDVDLDDLSGATVAAKVGLPLEQVYKTLVCRGDKVGVIFAVVATNKEISLKQLAISANDKKCQVVPLKEVQPLTGYVRGGVTVLGAKKPYPVYVDEDILLCPIISVSAGARGLQILMAPNDYVKVTAAQLVRHLGRAEPND